MAQTQIPSQRGMIDDFEDKAMALMREFARYAAEGPGADGTEEEASANIRRLRIIVSSLNAALQGLQFIPQRPVAPPPQQVKPDA